MMNTKVLTKSNMVILGLVIIFIFVTIQESSYLHAQGMSNQTGNQIGNQTNETSTQRQFEEGEEIGAAETL